MITWGLRFNLKKTLQLKIMLIVVCRHLWLLQIRSFSFEYLKRENLPLN